MPLRKDIIRSKGLPFVKPPDLLRLEPKINRLLKKHGLDRFFDAEDLERLIYYCPREREFDVFKPVIKHLKDPQVTEEVLLTLHNELWNHTPLKMLGGRSPWQVTRSLPESRRVEDGDWLKLSEYLLGCQGFFQTQVYRAVENLSRELREEVFDNSHLLFQRYVYAALTGEEGVASPWGVLELEAERLKVRLPADSQITLKVFRSPQKSSDAHRQMRMTMGLESWAQFPLIFDLSVGEKNKRPSFFADPFYLLLLKRLKINLQPEPKNCFRTLVLEALDFWWQSQPAVSAIFKKDEWESFWLEVLRTAVDDWALIDEAFDRLLKIAESRGAAFGFLRKNLEAPRGSFYDPESSGEILQEKFLFDFGRHLTLYFLTPLTTYFPLLELYYREPFDAAAEIREFLEVRGTGLTMNFWLAKPPTAFRLRPLARELLKEEL